MGKPIEVQAWSKAFPDGTVSRVFFTQDDATDEITAVRIEVPAGHTTYVVVWDTAVDPVAPLWPPSWPAEQPAPGYALVGPANVKQNVGSKLRKLDTDYSIGFDAV